jgi:hypothetical protein
VWVKLEQPVLLLMLLDATGLLTAGAMELVLEPLGVRIQKQLAGVIILILSQKTAGNILRTAVVWVFLDAAGKVILFHSLIARLIGVLIAHNILQV